MPRVCVVGAGGREHALAGVLARSADVVVVPGNPGMSGWRGGGSAAGGGLAAAGGGLAAAGGLGSVELSDRRPEEIDADLWVIGPEAPLVDGLADRLRAAGHLVVGPGADGARLEGSKAWMKDLLARAGVPTAAYRSFDRPGPAVDYLRSLAPPWVVKTDGLAAGKGVLVTRSLEEAEADVVAKLSGSAFGAAGRRVVIEEGMAGPELSLIALCDGTRAVALAPAQDLKRVGDGDVGPNTGGMGAYSPVPAVDDGLVEEIMATAVRPTLAALARLGIEYRGFLYAGLMLTEAGPRVVELNVRLGDPEAQVILPRWEGDVVGLLAAAAAGRLDEVEPPCFEAGAAVCVVLAADGYPAAPRTGDPIRGLADAAGVPGVTVYFAGVAADPAGDGLRTAGGRVLGVTGRGATLDEARWRAYAGAERISWPGCHYRRDIAAPLVGGPGTAL